MFESDNRRLLRKPEFLFRDAIEEDEENLYDDNYKWLCQIRNQCFFLPIIRCIFPLSCLQSMSLHQYMDWDLVKTQSGVSVGRISNHIAFPVGCSREILELLPGSMK